MGTEVFKLGIILLALTTYGDSAKGKEYTASVCNPLKYHGPVDEKPDLIIGQLISLKNSKSGDIREGVCKLFASDTRSAPVTTGTPFDRGTTGLDYDSKTKTIFWSSTHRIYKIHLNGSKEEIFKKSRKDGPIEGIAYDWVANNLYISHTHAIKVLNLNKPSKDRKNLLTSNKSLGIYQGIAVHPNKGYIFIKYVNEIIRANLDGSNNFTILHLDEEYKNDYVFLRDFALDYHENKLYWSVNPAEKAIRYSKFDGTDIKSLKIQDSGTTHSITVDKKYVYYQPQFKGSSVEANKETSLLRRVNKITGEMDAKFQIDNFDSDVQYGEFSQFILLNGQPQLINADHPCKTKNGGCSGFCFAVPDKKTGKLTKTCA